MASQLYNQLNQKLTEEILKKMVQNNPQAMQIINDMKVSGYTPKEFFYKKADEMGVNPKDVFNQIL